jgi:hypothetical protein
MCHCYYIQMYPILICVNATIFLFYSTINSFYVFVRCTTEVETQNTNSSCWFSRVRIILEYFTTVPLVLSLVTLNKSRLRSSLHATNQHQNSFNYCSRNTVYLDFTMNEMSYFFHREEHFLSPTLWFSGQSFWLQIHRSRVRFPALPDFWEAAGLERGPLSLVRTTEELLEGKSRGSGLENRD